MQILTQWVWVGPESSTLTWEADAVGPGPSSGQEDEFSLRLQLQALVTGKTMTPFRGQGRGGRGGAGEGGDLTQRAGVKKQKGKDPIWFGTRHATALSDTFSINYLNSI